MNKYDEMMSYWLPDTKQNPYEVYQVLEYLGDRKFNSFLELGIGGSLRIYANMLCNKGAVIIGIDIRNFEGLEGKFIYDNTDNAHKLIEDDSIELLHLDACKTNVFKDWNNYYPKVKKGGVILIHDTELHEYPMVLADKLKRKGLKLLPLRQRKIL